MANDPRILFEQFKRGGMADRDAMWAVVDHFNKQHWYDRDAYKERIDKLEKRVAELERIAGGRKT